MTDKGTSKIVTALLAARKAMGKVHKSGKNQFQHYSYANMEDILKAIEGPLEENGLAVVTSVDEVIQQDNRTTKKGGIEYSVRVKLTMTLHHSSGETLEAKGWGEGQDGGDKGIYAAITGGRKYALCSLFNLATTDDPEKNNHEPESGQKPPQEPQGTSQKGDQPSDSDSGPAFAQKLQDEAKLFVDSMDKCQTTEELTAWQEVPANKTGVNQLPADHREDIINHGLKLKAFLWLMDGLRACKSLAELITFGVDHCDSYAELEKPYQEKFDGLSFKLKGSI